MTRRENTRTLSVELPLQLELASSDGNVEVQGEERNDVELRYSVEIRFDSAVSIDDVVASIEAGIRLKGSSLRIEAPPAGSQGGLHWQRGPAFKVDYELRVPRAARLSVEARNGRIQARDLAGPVVVRSHNAAVEVEQIAGPVDVRGANGRIGVRDCSSSLKVDATNGPVQIERGSGPARITTRNGPLRISDLGAALQASSANGPISYSGAIRGDFDCSTTNGPIVLHLPGDSRFEVDAESDRSFVRSDFDITATPAGNGPRPKLKLRSHNGPITIGRL